MENKKIMSTLYIVGTPIGNLEDITLRAIRVLGEVDIIACEDTRHTVKLLNHLGIKKQLISYHEHNENERSEEIISRLANGENIAIVSDAGMPCISDPGAVVIRLAREAGCRIEVIPGASAVISAAALAGLDSGFTFTGFLPRKGNSRRDTIEDYIQSKLPVIFYSSPHNISKDIADIFKIYGEREIFIIKEITKIYERVIHTTLANANLENPKGEFVLIVMPKVEHVDYSNMPIKEQVLELIENGSDKNDAIKQVARLRGINKNVVYQEMIEV